MTYQELMNEVNEMIGRTGEMGDGTILPEAGEEMLRRTDGEIRTLAYEACHSLTRLYTALFSAEEDGRRDRVQRLDADKQPSPAGLYKPSHGGYPGVVR